MTVLFAEDLLKVFGELPETRKHQAAQCIEPLASHPRMYPIRRRGLMRGYRYFIAGRFLFYYSIAGDEVRMTAVIPAAMRQA